MADTLYNMMRIAGVPFAYRCIGVEQLPGDSPLVFIANHLGSLGPIQMMLTVPRRAYPWVIAEMLDYRRAPQYLYDDFVQRAWKLNGRLGLGVSFLLSRLSVGMLRGLGSIAVDRNRGEYMFPFRRSLELLCQGKDLLVFPENTASPLDVQTGMHPFFCGFALLAPLYFQETGKRLPFIPAVVTAARRTVLLGEPVYYALGGTRNRGEVSRICGQLKQEIHRLDRRALTMMK